jgi:hypothetical protein
MLDLWDEHEEVLGRVRSVIDGNGLLLFFRRGDDVFGAPEEGRIVFAKMKAPDEETPEDWAKDASFSAFDLMKALAGEVAQSIFSHKDLGGLEIMDRDSVEQHLASNKKHPGKGTPKLKSHHGKDGAGKIKLKDKK